MECQETEQTRYRFSDLMRWVEHATGAAVCLEDLAGVTYEVPLLRVEPSQHYHHGPYCEYAKLNGNQPRCAANKHRSIRKAQRLKAPFAGQCPFGLWERAQPVLHEGEVAAILYLGSLRGGGRLSAIGPAPYEGPSLRSADAKLRRRLEELGEMLARQMELILERWAAQGGRMPKKKPVSFYVDMLERFLDSRYEGPVSLADFAGMVGLHQNYLGSLIKRETGRTFRQALARKRIEKAKVLLRQGGRSITETAYACGFSDGNYFSATFRRLTGLSPRQFRDGPG